MVTVVWTEREDVVEAMVQSVYTMHVHVYAF